MKKVLGVLLVIVTLFALGVVGNVHVLAAAWKTGNFDSGYTARGYTTVWLDKDSKGNCKTGKIKIYTYNSVTGWQTSGEVHVTLKTTSGAWICEFDSSSDSTLTLGSNYPAYRVYIAKKSYPNTVKGRGDDFVNVGKCGYWAINATSNCYM